MQWARQRVAAEMHMKGAAQEHGCLGCGKKTSDMVLAGNRHNVGRCPELTDAVRQEFSARVLAMAEHAPAPAPQA